jgi:hypothetical protein
MPQTTSPPGRWVYCENQILLEECLDYDDSYTRRDVLHKKFILEVAKELLVEGANVEKRKGLPGQCPVLIMLYHKNNFDSVRLYLQYGVKINPNVHDEACGGSILNNALSRLGKAVGEKVAADKIRSLIVDDIKSVLFGNTTKPTVIPTDIIGYLQHFRRPFMEHDAYVTHTGPEYDVLPILVENLGQNEIIDGELFEMREWAIAYASLEGVQSLYSGRCARMDT